MNTCSSSHPISSLLIGFSSFWRNLLHLKSNHWTDFSEFFWMPISITIEISIYLSVHLIYCMDRNSTKLIVNWKRCSLKLPCSDKVIRFFPFLFRLQLKKKLFIFMLKNPRTSSSLVMHQRILKKLFPKVIFKRFCSEEVINLWSSKLSIHAEISLN